MTGATAAEVTAPAMSVGAGIDWTVWLRRWDAQQTDYLPVREERFTAVLDVLDVLRVLMAVK